MGLSAHPYHPSLIDEYTDYRLFIAEALRRMGCSRRDFAEVVDLSVSMVSEVLGRKRRLRPPLLPVLIGFFQLDTRRAEALAAMLDLDNESPQARRQAWLQIEARKHYLGRDRSMDDCIEVMRSWYVAAIYELASCEGFRADPAWIAATLRPHIQVEEAERALNILLRIGLLGPDPEGGELTPLVSQLWTEHKVPRGRRSDATYELHKDVLRMAGEAPEEFRANEIHHTSVVAAVSATRAKQLNTRLEELLVELLHIASSPSEEPPNRVYSLMINLFPVSANPDGSDG